LSPRAPVIGCVRDVPRILDSIEQLVRKNKFQTAGIFNLDQSVKRHDAVLGEVWRSPAPEAPLRIGPKQIARMKSQDSMTKRGLDDVLKVLVRAIALYDEIAEPSLTQEGESYFSTGLQRTV
jgi:hypothetical protein